MFSNARLLWIFVSAGPKQFYISEIQPKMGRTPTGNYENQVMQSNIYYCSEKEEQKTKRKIRQSNAHDVWPEAKTRACDWPAKCENNWKANVSELYVSGRMQISCGQYLTPSILGFDWFLFITTQREDKLNGAKVNGGPWMKVGCCCCLKSIL